MEDKRCPMKIKVINGDYWCLGDKCAWWVKVWETKDISGRGLVGRCAVAQLGKEINCYIKGGL